METPRTAIIDALLDIYYATPPHRANVSEKHLDKAFDVMPNGVGHDARVTVWDEAMVCYWIVRAIGAATSRSGEDYIQACRTWLEAFSFIRDGGQVVLATASIQREKKLAVHKRNIDALPETGDNNDD